MAKKPNMTPREKVVAKALATNPKKASNLELATNLELLADASSVLQELAYFRAIGVKVPDREMRDKFEEVSKLFEVMTKTYPDAVKTGITEITVTVK